MVKDIEIQEIESRLSKISKIHGPEKAVKIIANQLKRTIEELNTLNAIENTGAVDVNALLKKYKLTQEQFNNHYAKAREIHLASIEKDMSL